MKKLVLSQSDEAILRLRIKKEGHQLGCWIWTGALSYGYGQLVIAGKNWGVHRVMLWLSVGPPPRGKPLALHRCDNPSCCNPDHLYWGDSKENAQDLFDRNKAHASVAPVTARANVRERMRVRMEISGLK